MYTVHPAVNLAAQITQYDCWRASLRMMCKWKNGGASEPSGTHTEWLYRKCREAQNGYNAERDRNLPPNPTKRDYREANTVAAGRVQAWSQRVELQSNGAAYSPFNSRPGLTLALLPTILAENKLWAVKGNMCIRPELRDVRDVEGLLRAHGPLYCLVDYGHVVIVVGVVDGEEDAELQILDPQLDGGPHLRGTRLVSDSPCIARIASMWQ
jgi:hypothetical protein